MSFTNKISVGVDGKVFLVENMVEPGAPEARWFEAKVGGEFGDEEREERVKEEENDEDPFKKCID